jgi:hypothetical protein
MDLSVDRYQLLSLKKKAKSNLTTDVCGKQGTHVDQKESPLECDPPGIFVVKGGRAVRRVDSSHSGERMPNQGHSSETDETVAGASLSWPSGSVPGPVLDDRASAPFCL